MSHPNTNNPDVLKAELQDAQSELNSLTRKQKEDMPLYVAWLELVIHANQRQLMRLNKTV